MQEVKKVLITVGGTGGHIYPALALAEQLIENQVDCLFVGGRLATNRYFASTKYPFKTVDCSGISLKKPWLIPPALFRIGKGVGASLSIIRDYKPDLIVGFGSYYTLPTLLAAKWAEVPFILHEANSIPGRVNRWFSPYALTTGVHFSQTKKHLKGVSREVGMPLRFNKESVSRDEAYSYFNLKEGLPVLLVVGGSQGARIFDQPLDVEGVQVIHIGNDVKYDKVSAVVKPFEEKMHLALAIADLAVCRAGASTIAELIEFEVPALFIPYPHAMDNHQEHNARYVVDHVKGGLLLREKDFSSLFSATFQKLLENRHKMRENISLYKQQKERQDLLGLVKQFITTERK